MSIRGRWWQWWLELLLSSLSTCCSCTINYCWTFYPLVQMFIFLGLHMQLVCIFVSLVTQSHSQFWLFLAVNFYGFYSLIIDHLKFFKKCLLVLVYKRSVTVVWKVVDIDFNECSDHPTHGKLRMQQRNTCYYFCVYLSYPNFPSCLVWIISSEVLFISPITHFPKVKAFLQILSSLYFSLIFQLV